MKRETREVNGTASPSADVSFLYAQDRATFGSKIREFYNKYTRTLTIFALACILSVSGVLIAKISTDYSRVGSGNSEIATTRDVDVSALVDKYKEYFVPRDNGTVEFDYNIKQTRTVNQAIEAQDIDALDEYIEMLHNINALVDDGTMYIADDGNYYLSQSDVQTFTNVGGRNSFSIRTESHKVLFVTITVPVGYQLDLAVSLANIVNIVMQNVKQADIWKQGALNGLEFFGNLIKQMYPNTSNIPIAEIQKIYDITRDILVNGQKLYSAIKFVFGAGAADSLNSMAGVLIGGLSDIYYEKFAKPMGEEALRHYLTSDSINTVRATCNLIFGDVRISSLVA